MKEFIDKLIGRLENVKGTANGLSDIVWNNAVKMCIREVNELAEEYKGKESTYEITLNGCDDDTVFTMDLTTQEYELLVSVSELANETSTYGCMPRLFVERKGE